jgi:hypothetical protein
LPRRQARCRGLFFEISSPQALRDHAEEGGSDDTGLPLSRLDRSSLGHRDNVEADGADLDGGEVRAGFTKPQ